MPQVTFIRHAMTRFNARLDDESIPDSRITQIGVSQAAKLNNTFDILILSPLKRTMETYTNSNIKTNKVIISEYFREHMRTPLNFTALEDHSYVESTVEIEKRIDKAIKYIKMLGLKFDKIGVITHYDFLRHITKRLFGKELKFRNCDQITFHFEL